MSPRIVLPSLTVAALAHLRATLKTKAARQRRRVKAAARPARLRAKQ